MTWRWVRILTAAAIYLAAGLVFGRLAGAAATDDMRRVWRLAAWAVSAAVYAAHIGHEQVRLRSGAVPSALRAALAAAIGAFGLAVAATVHSMSVGAANGSRMRLALAVWPVMTFVPAFLVALVGAVALARVVHQSPARGAPNQA